MRILRDPGASAPPPLDHVNERVQPRRGDRHASAINLSAPPGLNAHIERDPGAACSLRSPLPLATFLARLQRAANSVLASAAFRVIGFSQTTCFPASAALIVNGTWR